MSVGRGFVEINWKLGKFTYSDNITKNFMNELETIDLLVEQMINYNRQKLIYLCINLFKESFIQFIQLINKL